MTLRQSSPPATVAAKQPVRNPNLDLIRCVAVLLVLSGHFFLNVDFYNIDTLGAGMAMAYIIRMGCLACVPMFVMLTGYLCNQKRLSAGYFWNIIPTLTTYVLVCILLLLREILVHHETLNPWEELLQILAIGNGTIRYAWYVEMYIGLYLLIPFLNLIYHNLNGKKEKQMLLGVFLFLTMAPLFLNDYDLMTPGFLKQLNLSRTTHELLPSWWTGIWPLTYYFLGAYIREYDIKIPKWKNVLLLAACIILFGLFDFYRNWGSKFRDLYGNQSGSLQITLISVLLFLILLHLDLTKLPRWGTGILRWISTLSFGIYLCSALSDRLVYRSFIKLPISFTVKYLSMPLAVLNSFVIALFLSQMIAWVQALLFGMVNWVIRLRQKS